MLKAKEIQPQKNEPFQRIGKPVLVPAISKFLVCRRSDSGELEYLYDQWKEKIKFSSDPISAKVTGFSWLYEADAVFVKERIERELGVVGLGIVSVTFNKEKDGTWSYSKA